MKVKKVMIAVALLAVLASGVMAGEKAGMLYPQTDFWTGLKYVDDLNGMSYRMGSAELKSLLTSTTEGMAYYSEYESKQMIASVVEIGSVVIILAPTALMAYSYNSYESYVPVVLGGIVLGCVGEIVASMVQYDAGNNFYKAVNAYNRAFGCGREAPKNYNLPPQGNPNTGNSGEVIKGGAAYNF